MSQTIAQHFQTALQHHQAGNFAQAKRSYQRVLDLKPNHAATLNAMGVLACQANQLAEGVKWYRKAVQADPQLVDGHQNLAMALEQLGEFQGAIAHFQQVLQLQPDLTAARSRLGQLWLQVGNIEGAIAETQTVATQQPNAENYWRLAVVLNQGGRFEEAILQYEQAIAHGAPPIVRYDLGRSLEQQGQTEAAIAQYEQAVSIQPDLVEAVWANALALPILYDSPEEIEPARVRFQMGLTELIQTPLETPAQCQAALRGALSRTNFYLAYQGKNDRDLQVQYGQWIRQIAVANFPQFAEWTENVQPAQGKRRIGYLSAHMMAHSAAAWVRGWMQGHDRAQFEIITYHIGVGVDAISEEIRSLSDQLRYLPNFPIEKIAEQVRRDRLDILVFTDIGMDPKTTVLAALKLAPVQCTAWGHPVTSGLPTIDYYLSSDLMEPENAQDHYSESLIRLPNIGIRYSKPPLPEVTHPRSHFSLKESAIVYLCFQSPFKYLPQHDWVFAAIANSVPDAQFLFMQSESKSVADRLRDRLQRAFKTYDLDSEQFCQFLPKLDRPVFWSLNLVADVFLDALAWTGGNSTLEAVAYGLPVVTYAGEFMRGRHSLAILRRLGVTETIAHTPDAYVELAVKLGSDRAFRERIRQQILAGHDRLYDDDACVRALEQAYLEWSKA